MTKRIYSLLQLFIAVAAFSLPACSKSSSGPSNTTLVYSNHTFTPITITINDSSSTIPPNASLSYTGKPGSSCSGTASTSGSASSGAAVGSVMTWTIDDQFPTSGSTTKTLDVGPAYFFLEVDNTSSYPVSGIYVNYDLTAQTFENVGFGAGTFNVGYYAAYSNSNVRCLGPNGGYWQTNVNLAGTSNQSFLFTLTD